MEVLLLDEDPAYVRVSRSATEDVYDEHMPFTLNKANRIAPSERKQYDAAIITCGELVP